MKCDFEYGGLDGDRHIYRCECGRVVRLREPVDPASISAVCGRLPPPPGPGTHFRRVRVELEIPEKCGGKCAELEAEMNAAGVSGCRDRRDYFLAKLRENAKDYGLLDWAKAGFHAVLQGKPRTLEGLFDLAIDRAETLAAKRPDSQAASNQPAPAPPLP